MSLATYTAKTWVDYADTPCLEALELNRIDAGIAAVTAEVLSLEALLPSTYQPISSELSALAGLSSTGYAKRGATAASWGVVASIPQADVSGLTAALAGLQPLDSDLTAIAALTTTTFGRSLLTVADATAARTAIGAQVAGSYEPALGSSTAGYLLSSTGTTRSWVAPYAHPATHPQSVVDSASGWITTALAGKQAAGSYRYNLAPTLGAWFQGTPLVGSDGVMEVGYIIDFHAANANTTDYDYRITTNGSVLTGSGYINAAGLQEGGVNLSSKYLPIANPAFTGTLTGPAATFAGAVVSNGSSIQSNRATTGDVFGQGPSMQYWDNGYHAWGFQLSNSLGTLGSAKALSINWFGSVNGGGLGWNWVGSFRRVNVAGGTNNGGMFETGGATIGTWVVDAGWKYYGADGLNQAAWSGYMHNSNGTVVIGALTGQIISLSVAQVSVLVISGSAITAGQVINGTSAAFSGTLTRGGNVVWDAGNLNPASLSFGFVPSTTNTYSLGSTSNRWLNVYATNVYEGGLLLQDKYQAKGSYGQLSAANTWSGSNTFAANTQFQNVSFTTNAAGASMTGAAAGPYVGDASYGWFGAVGLNGPLWARLLVGYNGQVQIAALGGSSNLTLGTVSSTNTITISDTGIAFVKPFTGTTTISGSLKVGVGGSGTFGLIKNSGSVLSSNSWFCDNSGSSTTYRAPWYVGEIVAFSNESGAPTALYLLAHSGCTFSGISEGGSHFSAKTTLTIRPLEPILMMANSLTNWHVISSSGVTAAA